MKCFHGERFVEFKALDAGVREALAVLPLAEFVQGAPVVDRGGAKEQEDGMRVDLQQGVHRLPEILDAALGRRVPG